MHEPTEDQLRDAAERLKNFNWAACGTDHCSDRTYEAMETICRHYLASTQWRVVSQSQHEPEERLREIRERHEKATPGPWEWSGQFGKWALLSRVPGVLIVLDAIRWGLQSAVFRFRSQRHDVMCKATENSCFRHPDAEFIAHSREDLPYLLARVESAEAKIGRLRSALQAELAELERGSDGRTHWTGCETSHPMCAAARRIREALQPTGENHDA